MAKPASLVDLLGLPLTENATAAFLSSQGKKELPVKKAFPSGGSTTIYRLYTEAGFELVTRKGAEEKDEIVDSIFLYNYQPGKHKQFKGALPYGIEMGMKAFEVVAKLGEPSRKGGGGATPIFIGYPAKHVSIAFRAKTWEDRETPIDYVLVAQDVSKN
mmetsp:Transcript_35012/g.90706  ORF Transcript_35012/g.90706 Transcript_35012/m.90706 type:complete len:159 (-) Transcript_35012:3091-3567(-)